MLSWDYLGDGVWAPFSHKINNGELLSWRVRVNPVGTFEVIDLQSGSDLRTILPNLEEAQAHCEIMVQKAQKAYEVDVNNENQKQEPDQKPFDTYRFNLNQQVRFKPTDEGGGIIYDMLSDVSSQHKARYGVLVHLLKQWSTDSDGFVTVKFWEFMQVFGPHMRIGGPAYFVDNAVDVLPVE